MNGAQIVYDIFYLVIFNIVVAGMEFNFFLRFSEHKQKLVPYICYISLTLLVSVLEIKVHPAPLLLLFLIARIALLLGMGVIFLKIPLTMSLLGATITKLVSYLAIGTSASVTFLIAPLWIQAKFELAVLGVVQSFFSFLIIAIIYQIILKKFLWRGGLPNQYSAVFFLPISLIVIVEQYILNQVYGITIVVEGETITKPVADNWQILLIQLFAYLGLFSIMYACQKLSEDVSNRMRCQLLEQEIASQRDYVEESNLRYKQTQSFRHDVKQHLLVLNGLLERGEVQQAKDYLDKLERIPEQFSYPCKTGNTVTDTLLSSKLSIAIQYGIRVECTVKIPSSCNLDDLDLCVLFSNAVDNAIHACRQQGGKGCFIRISGKQKGDFFMLEVENSCPYAGAYKKGIGLTNIEAVAEKYSGAVTTQLQGGCFFLNVLLVISRSLDDISGNPH